MYNRNKKTVLNSVHLPPLKIYQKCSMMSIRHRRFDLLPVIQEEEGSLLDEIEFNNYLFDNNSLAKKQSIQKRFSVSNKSDESAKIKSNTKLPPLNNINCMMNMEMKHSNSLWDSSFSKKLINGRSIKDNIKSPRANEKKLFLSKSFNKRSFGDHFFLPCERPSQCRILDGNQTISAPPKQNITAKKKRPKVAKSKRNSFREEKARPKHEKAKSSSETNVEKVKESKASVTTNVTSQINSNSPRHSFDTFEKSSTISRNQRFLTECVKSILESDSSKISCECCGETFLDQEELNVHRKVHQEDKQECLLCGEVFYSGNLFVQHLLSHEGVDKYSCKKCKKYFPSLKTYKVHCQKIHLIPSDSLDTFDQKMKHLKECLPKFECVRCDAKYNTEEALDNHRKVHAKQDLVGAYLLSSQGIVL